MGSSSREHSRPCVSGGAPGGRREVSGQTCAHLRAQHCGVHCGLWFISCFKETARESENVLSEEDKNKRSFGLNVSHFLSTEEFQLRVREEHVKPRGLANRQCLAGPGPQELNSQAEQLSGIPACSLRRGVHHIPPPHFPKLGPGRKGCGEECLPSCLHSICWSFPT